MPAKVLLRSRLAQVAIGQVVTDADYDLLVTGEVDVFKPNGDRLATVRRGVVSAESRSRALPSLRMLKGQRSYNRGSASGAPCAHRVLSDGRISSTLATVSSAPSAIAGYFNRSERIPYCRQTAFTAKHAQEFSALYPLMHDVSAKFAEAVPERFATQMGLAQKTSQDFVIDGTPWTTITVNTNWATHTHTDKGDLDEGFSCLTVLRSGTYRGGVLVFPAFRVGVDLRDGDLVMMDAHEVHGNTPFYDMSEDYERISVVLYYRTKMASCGTAMQELERAKGLRGTISVEDEAEAEGVEA